MNVFIIGKLPTTIKGHTVVSTQDSNVSELFQQTKQGIETADCVLAEVTNPTSDDGGQIVYALTHHKPVLALFYKDAPNKLSPLLVDNPSDHLFIEHYDEDSLPIIVKHFFDQVEIEKNRRGKLIVIDGGDGSGKATQAALLVEYLKQNGLTVKAMDFPRYYSSFHGSIAGRFLSGEFGDNVSPYLASLAYALDRASAKEEMDHWLSGGGIIVSNRYASSNMAHQGARLSPEKREEFLDWVDELEYKVHKIPREDIVIYLRVPWQIGIELTKQKGERAYLHNAQDILETDVAHRAEAEAMYVRLAKQKQNWVVVECTKDGSMLDKATIAKQIIDVLQEKALL